jgi:hypothetical protein
MGARILHPGGYGELVTLLNVLLVAFVPTLAVQTVTARRVAVGDSRGTLLATLTVAGIDTTLLTLMAPLLTAFLNLPDSTGLIFAALVLPGASIQGWCQGIWQGREEFGALAVAVGMSGVARSGIGLAALVATHSPVLTVASSTGGATCSAVGCLWLLRVHARSSLRRRRCGEVIREFLHASHGYAAFLVLTVADQLLARHVLPGEAAAAYAAGAVLARVALWLPQSVVSVLFASLVRHGGRMTLYLRTAGVLAAFGIAEVFLAAVLSHDASMLVGGSKFPQLPPDLWLFAAIGASLSLIQFSLVASLAVRSVSVIVLLWSSVAAEVLGVAGTNRGTSVHEVALTIAAICGASAVVSVALRLRAMRRVARYELPMVGSISDALPRTP